MGNSQSENLYQTIIICSLKISQLSYCPVTILTYQICYLDFMISASGNSAKDIKTEHWALLLPSALETTSWWRTTTNRLKISKHNCLLTSGWEWNILQFLKMKLADHNLNESLQLHALLNPSVHWSVGLTVKLYFFCSTDGFYSCQMHGLPCFTAPVHVNASFE